MSAINENDILEDLQALEYIIMCRPYGWDRINCHGQLGYVLKLYRRLQRKARKPLHFSQRIRWTNAHKMYLKLREEGYFNPKVTTCSVCSFCMSPVCEFKDYTKYTKYK